MRHLVALLLLCLGMYFAWRYSPAELREAIKRFWGAHLPWVLLIVVSLFAALVGAFYSRSFNIL